MKENKYDNAGFFHAYSKFPRSVEGLEAAGEWHIFREMLPGFKGKRVLDLGCGFGWHCRYAAEQGAKSVCGVDLSEKMLAVAKEKTVFPNVEYQRIAIEEIDFAPDSFDVVLSSLAFHYVESFEDICRKVSACLTDGGDFVFCVEHPVFTAQGPQEWFLDGDKNRLHWPVDRYFEEGGRKALFLGETVVKYHKTLTTYSNGLLKNEFIITGLVEPQPSVELLRLVPAMEEELRRPMMLIVSSRKMKKGFVTKP